MRDRFCAQVCGEALAYLAAHFPAAREEAAVVALPAPVLAEVMPSGTVILDRSPPDREKR